MAVKTLTHTQTILKNIDGKLYGLNVGIVLGSLWTTRKESAGGGSFTNITACGDKEDYGVVQVGNMKGNVICVQVYWQKRPYQSYLYDVSADEIL